MHLTDDLVDALAGAFGKVQSSGVMRHSVALAKFAVAPMFDHTSPAWSARSSGVDPSNAIGTTPEVWSHLDASSVNTAWA